MDFSSGPPEIDPAALKRLPSAERKEVEALLAELSELVKVNPLWAYKPHSKQAEYHLIRTFFGAFIGGNRSGKTFGGTADDVLQLVDRSEIPPWLQPFKVFDEFFGRVIVPGQSESLDVVLPMFRRLIPKSQLYKGEWERSYDQRRRKLMLANGNWVDFMSHDQNVDRFAGVTLHRVRFDEEPPGTKGKAIFNESVARTTEIANGQIRFTMTPLLGLSWSYHLLTKDGKPRHDEECQTVTVSMGDNPHLPKEQIERVLAVYSDTEREAREHGHFVHLAGLVYPMFGRDRHIVPVEEIPRDSQGEPLWDFYDGIDPGYGHPMGYCLTAVDAYGVVRVIRSWKMAGKTVADCAARIHRDREELNVKPRYTIIDPSSRNKNHATGRSVQLEYAEEGIHTMPGQNSRAAGINRLATYLERDKLLLWADQEELRDEFEMHRWKAQVGENEKEPEVIKTNDDILDPLRYILMSRPPLTKTREEELKQDSRQKLLADSIKSKVGRNRGRRASSWGASTLR